MRPVLGLIALLAGGLLVHELVARPDYGRPPRLAAVIDDGGKMEEYLATADQKEAILTWVQSGAPERDWERVARVLEDRCTNCHFSGASYEMLPLDNYASAAAAAEVKPVLLEKITGGTMGEYLESAEAQAELAAWIEAGAPESAWPDAREILIAHCLQCHNPEGVQGIVSLQSYPIVARLATLAPAAPRPIAAPGLVLVAALGALVVFHRRSSN